MNPKQERELIAFILKDAAPSPAVRRWLDTPEGQRELQAYRSTLEALTQAYADAPGEALRVTYAVFDAPLGERLWVAASDGGVVRVAFGGGEAAFVRELRRRLKTDPVRADDLTALAELREYLAGQRLSFDAPVDLRLATPFQRRVLEAAQAVPRGQTRTYGEVARTIGQPRAARAVGQALAHNPVPILVPCHRVLAGDGALRGYLGSRGVGFKAWLLELEGARSARPPAAPAGRF